MSLIIKLSSHVFQGSRPHSRDRASRSARLAAAAERFHGNAGITLMQQNQQEETQDLWSAAANESSKRCVPAAMSCWLVQQISESV
jgi:hypothetical protein